MSSRNLLKNPFRNTGPVYGWICRVCGTIYDPYQIRCNCESEVDSITRKGDACKCTSTYRGGEIKDAPEGQYAVWSPAWGWCDIQEVPLQYVDQYPPHEETRFFGPLPDTEE